MAIKDLSENMEFVSFDDVKDRISNDIKRHSLVLIVGSGFSRGCKTEHGGVVPSGKQYKEYMLTEIKNNKAISEEEMSIVNKYSFSQVSEVYNSSDVVPSGKRRNYLIKNFKDVIIADKNKTDFLNVQWDYIYTLNIDDAIEKNSRFSQVVYANRKIYDDIFSKAPTVIKLHGDVDDIVKYKDSHCEIFDVKQYAVSPETNSDLLKVLKHDFEYQNIIFVGCSLSDEMDLAYLSHYDAVSTTNRYYCHVGKIGKIGEIQLRKFGITHCVRFDNYDSIYSSIYRLFEETNKIKEDELDDYINCKYEIIESGYEQNSQYLFEGKSPIVDKTSVLLPNFFIQRNITKEIIQKLSDYPLHILYGQGCSGRSYIGIEISYLIRDKSVFFFESKNSLANHALESLLKKKKSIIIFDEQVLSYDQVEILLNQLSAIKGNRTIVLLIARSSDRDLPGMITYALNKERIHEEDVRKINIINYFTKAETNSLNSSLVRSSLGVFFEDRSIIDNIICCANELSEQNRFTKITPVCNDVRHLACLILLAIKRKVYSKDVVMFDLEKEMNEQCKMNSPLIEQDYTKGYEVYQDNNSPIKYVVNAEYWLREFLSSYVAGHKKEVIEAFKYIIRQIVIRYGKPDISFSVKDAPYKDYILFDNIVYIFQKQANMFVINDIYKALNDDLSADPNYLHQRAKCCIRLSDIAKPLEEKKQYLDKAFRDANSAYSVFEMRFHDTKNDKVYISVSHTLYTKALCMCHLCNVNNFRDKSWNTATLKVLVSALQMPHNTYKKQNDDRYNYGDVVKKFSNIIMTNTDLIDNDELKTASTLINLLRQY